MTRELLKVATPEIQKLLNIQQPSSLTNIARKYAFVLCDRYDGNKIIFGSPQFETDTGYSLGEFIGKNPRFLQGEQTRESSRGELRHIIENNLSGTVDIVNYHKSGTPINMRISLTPIKDKNRRTIAVLGTQLALPFE